jgi:chromate reductase, NAD(P)H dehydrogenase (quinone)
MIDVKPDGPPTLLLIAGSLRAKSANAAVLRTLQHISVGDDRITVKLGPSPSDLPHFDPDVPDHQLAVPVMALRSSLAASDAVVFSTPEYAGALPGSFKNLLDWTVGGTQMAGKKVGWVNTSLGPTRAAGTYASLRTVLGFVSAHIVDDLCVDIAVKHSDVGEDGLLTSGSAREHLTILISHWVEELRGAGR